MSASTSTAKVTDRECIQLGAQCTVAAISPQAWSTSIILTPTTKVIDNKFESGIYTWDALASKYSAAVVFEILLEPVVALSFPPNITLTKGAYDITTSGYAISMLTYKGFAFHTVNDGRTESATSLATDAPPTSESTVVETWGTSTGASLQSSRSISTSLPRSSGSISTMPSITATPEAISPSLQGGTIAGIATGGVLLLALTIVGWYIWRHKQRSRRDTTAVLTEEELAKREGDGNKAVLDVDQVAPTSGAYQTHYQEISGKGLTQELDLSLLNGVGAHELKAEDPSNELMCPGVNPHRPRHENGVVEVGDGGSRCNEDMSLDKGGKLSGLADFTSS